MQLTGLNQPLRVKKGGDAGSGSGPSQDEVDNLMQMGFTDTKVRKALKNTVKLNRFKD